MTRYSDHGLVVYALRVRSSPILHEEKHHGQRLLQANADYFSEITHLYKAVKILASQPQHVLDTAEQLQVADFVRKVVVRFIALDVLNMVLDYAYLQLTTHGIS